MAWPRGMGYLEFCGVFSINYKWLIYNLYNLLSLKKLNDLLDHYLSHIGLIVFWLTHSISSSWHCNSKLHHFLLLSSMRSQLPSLPQRSIYSDSLLCPTNTCSRTLIIHTLLDCNHLTRLLLLSRNPLMPENTISGWCTLDNFKFEGRLWSCREQKP
jgi:hypothetical protein